MAPAPATTNFMRRALRPLGANRCRARYRQTAPKVFASSEISHQGRSHVQALYFAGGSAWDGLDHVEFFRTFEIGQALPAIGNEIGFGSSGLRKHHGRRDLLAPGRMRNAEAHGF